MEFVKWQKVERISEYNPQNERVNQSFQKHCPRPLIISFWLLQLECSPSQKWLFSSQPHSVLAPFAALPPRGVSLSIRSFTQIPVPAAYSFRRGRGIMLWGVSGGTSPLRWWGRAWKLWPLWVRSLRSTRTPSGQSSMPPPARPSSSICTPNGTHSLN